MRLSRPEKRDAMSPTLNRRRMEVLDENEFREDVGMLVLTGEGTSWTAGMDLKEYFRETETNGLEGVRKVRELRLVAAPALVPEANRREPEKSGAGLDAYSTRALSRIWKALGRGPRRARRELRRPALLGGWPVSSDAPSGGDASVPRSRPGAADAVGTRSAAPSRPRGRL
jgi:hypothetical protein